MTIELAVLLVLIIVLFGVLLYGIFNNKVYKLIIRRLRATQYKKNINLNTDELKAWFERMREHEPYMSLISKISDKDAK